MIFWVIFIWAKATFFFEQLFPVVARTWLIPKSVTFFLAQNLSFWPKNPIFCYKTPILVNDPFVAIGVTVHFPPCDRFFDFPFRSYSSFRKKIRLTRQKVSPSPLWGHRLPITALALSARGLDNKNLILHWNFIPNSGTLSRYGGCH